MTEPTSTRNVVVTDIHMPFWSMVTFMVKWAIASIPALILVVIIATSTTAVISGLVASANHAARDAGSTSSSGKFPTSTLLPTIGVQMQSEDRCKGNPDPKSCVEQERRSSSETAEQRSARQLLLEAERKKNMEQVR